MVAFDTHIQQALRALRAGKAIVFPTDTVYGLGVAIEFAQGPEVLYAIKQRPSTKPIAWLVGSVHDIKRYGKEVPEYALRLAHTFWPGPLTLIVAASKHVPPAFCSREGTIGLRMPNNEVALQLIAHIKSPLCTTSANLSGQPSENNFHSLSLEILQAAGATLQDGTPKSGVASTVVDCTGIQPVILREGALSARDLQTCLQE